MTRTIRFFATNRDRERLGQRFDRHQRIKLQRSGYHWVDTIPVDAVISPSTERVFEKFLARPEIRKVVIGIHGFNVPLHGAITSFSLLAEALAATLEARGHSLVLDPEPAATTTGVSPPPAPAALDRAPQRDQIAFVGFSWPSDGRLLAYQSDRLEAVQSANALGACCA
ncbi:MAG: alpha/beta hydrolase [Cyanobacteria bacterium]|nr:alpha/beta hydrolase [Cyanobacteria bacterium bin.51]